MYYHSLARTDASNTRTALPYPNGIHATEGTNLKRAPSEIEKTNEPKTTIICNHDVRSAMMKLRKAPLCLKSQVQDKQKGRDNQSNSMPKSMALKEPSMQFRTVAPFF